MEEERDLWEVQAGWWQETFTEGADAEYVEQILPLAGEHLAGARRILDVGTGEGQVARHALAGQAVAGHVAAGQVAAGQVAAGHAVAAGGAGGVVVVGVDPTWAQIVVARSRGGGPHYARASADALPFPDASFDAAVACLVFEHIERMDEAIAEVGRVLEPGGRFVFMLNHPLLQAPGSGWIDDTILGEQYWRVGAYLVEDTAIEEVEKGVYIPFIHRPLSRYVNALAAAGLLVTAMAEPPPPPGFLARAPEYQDAATIPRLLLLRAEKLRPA